MNKNNRQKGSCYLLKDILYLVWNKKRNFPNLNLSTLLLFFFLMFADSSTNFCIVVKFLGGPIFLSSKCIVPMHGFLYYFFKLMIKKKIASSFWNSFEEWCSTKFAWWIKVVYFSKLEKNKNWIAKTTNGNYNAYTGFASPRNRKWVWKSFRRSYDFNFKSCNSILAEELGIHLE